jgi:CheY-like chemotaxis protein
MCCTPGHSARPTPRTRGRFNVSATAASAATVLLVEDDPGDVMMINEIWRDIGRPRDVRVVRDGLEALAFLRHDVPYADAPRPDLVLLDLNLPRMDGRQTLATIKASNDLRSIPDVVFTTSSAWEDVYASYQHHANAFVTKPVDLESLVTVICEIDRFFTEIAARPRIGGL